MEGQRLATSPEPVTPPTALTIAGSDSGGGAGIQADLKVFFVLGCHGTSALTALTAQNTVEVSGIHEVPADFVRAQINAVARDIGIDAAKTGMLASAEIVEAVSDSIESHSVSKLVVDPVFISKHRDTLLAESAIDSLRSKLFPLAQLVTPNLYETSALIGEEVDSLAGMRDAAKNLLDLGPQAVLVKGGHLEANDAVDVFYDGDRLEELVGPRYDTLTTHGTGCALSAAITARLAHGDELLTAVTFAKEFISGAIRRGIRIGSGYGPVNPGWRLQ